MANRPLASKGPTVRAPVSLSRLLRPGSKRVLYRGGPILTMDADNRTVEALAVDRERIAAAGDEVELREWAESKGARIVDLRGRALLPGFIDAHGHFPGQGIFAVHVDLNSPPIGQIRKMDDLVVTQMVIEDGWIAVALGPKPRLARTATHSPKK